VVDEPECLLRRVLTSSLSWNRSGKEPSVKHVFARRLGVLALGTTLAVGSYIPAAQAESTTPATASASSWLGRQLPATNTFPSSFDPSSPDVGLTIDVGLAALAAGDTALVERTVVGVSQNITAYTGFGAAATAKSLAFATAVDANPRSFGGVDLVARTESLIAANGRLTDPDFPQFDSSLGQSFAVRGLIDAGSTKAEPAQAYLAGLQCANGAIGFDSSAPGSAPGCTESGATPGADNTALVAGNLLATGSRAVRATARRAGDFLLAIEQGGAWGGGTATEAPNANSTGVAVSALGSMCEVGAAQRGVGYLRGVQVPQGATGALAGQDGAVALNSATYAAAQRDGIAPELVDQFVRATSQAAPALSWSSAYRLPRALKTKRVQAGGKVKAKVSCLQPGTRVVTKLRGTKVDKTKANAKGVAKVSFRVKGKAAQAVRVSKVGKGQVRKVTLKMKPAGTKAIKKTLRVTRP